MSGRLILVEGLPTSGKSTTAHLIARALGNATWHFEFELNHPIYDTNRYSELLRDGGFDSSYFEQALDRWSVLAAEIVASGKTVVLESALFQMAIHLMLLADRAETEIADYLRAVRDRILPANPTLVYFRDEDARRSLNTACSIRGDWYQGFLTERVGRSRLGIRREWDGFDGVAAYFTEYLALIERLKGDLDFPIREISMSRTMEDRNATIAQIFGLSSFGIPAERIPSAENLSGTYQADGGEDRWVVGTVDGALYLDGETRTPLLSVGSRSFELLGTPVTFGFRPDDAAPEWIECAANLPNLQRIWRRVS